MQCTYYRNKYILQFQQQERNHLWVSATDLEVEGKVAGLIRM